jgi:hypothetical protein
MVTTLHDGDLHPADKAYSQTHWMAGTSPAMTEPVLFEAKPRIVEPASK